MTHKIEHKYFDYQQIKEGQNGPDEFYINTRLKVKKRRNEQHMTSPNKNIVLIK